MFLKEKERNLPNDDYLLRLGIENNFSMTFSVLTTTVSFKISKHLLKKSLLKDYLGYKTIFCNKVPLNV